MFIEKKLVTLKDNFDSAESFTRLLKKPAILIVNKGITPRDIILNILFAVNDNFIFTFFNV